MGCAFKSMGFKLSTAFEKIAAIRQSMETTKKRIDVLNDIKNKSGLTKSQEYELDMCKRLIIMGEKILKEIY